MTILPRVDNQDPELFGQTPWQTVGPFFHYGLPWKGGADLVGDLDIGARPDLMPEEHYVLATPRPKDAILGEVIEITGRVLDGAGAPVPDAMIEIWQADAAGRYASAADPRAATVNARGFIGFGRSSTSEDGVFRFRTLRPGAVPGPGGAMQAPHIGVGVLGRGLLKRLVTRLYFAGAPENATDPILALVPPHRRDTLMATPEGAVWRFDVDLQGDTETVFFDC
jgi:protocatechuate 3,4-dioxygenase alpha subunit